MIRRFVVMLVTVSFFSARMMGTTVTVKVVNDAVDPFVGQLNGAPALFVCDDNKDVITNGETWLATETPLSAVIADVGPPNNGDVPGVYFGHAVVGATHVGTTLYEEAAWLVYQFAGYSTYAAAIQTAIWDIMDQIAAPPSGSLSDPGFWASAAAAQIGANGPYTPTSTSLTAAQIVDLFILTPTGYPGPGLGTGSPQEFFYFAPEPATYAMIGAGLILLSLGTFRRRAK